MATPQPGDLDQRRAQPRIARLRHALLMVDRAAPFRSSKNAYCSLLGALRDGLPELHECVFWAESDRGLNGGNRRNSGRTWAAGKAWCPADLAVRRSCH